MSFSMVPFVYPKAHPNVVALMVENCYCKGDKFYMPGSSQAGPLLLHAVEVVADGVAWLEL